MSNKLSEAFTKSTDAVFGIDISGHIRFVNSNCEKLLGYSCKQLDGASCAEVLCGKDISGNPFCGSNCPIPKKVTGQPSISDFDLMIKQADGNTVLVNIGANYVSQYHGGENDQVNVFFSLRQVNPQRLLQRMTITPEEAQKSDAQNTMTPRETEILRLAVEGMNTAQIANNLFISTQTVRSHFKNIYLKLGINSRTEAVIFAMKNRLH